jgi:hypothetical protein
METPILFLVFNRPSVTKRVFDKIRIEKPKKLFIAIDGPRKDNLTDNEGIKEVIKIVSNIDWECDLKILKREINLGCGKAISGAIDWFFSNVEEGIILEDDCDPSHDFFRFCISMLDKYRYEPRILAINGSNPLEKADIMYTYFYSKYNFVWGWATWKRAWDLYHFDLNIESKFQRLIHLTRSFNFDLVSIRSWYKHLNLVACNKIDTWDYQWMYICWKKNGMVVTPKSNLICNIGNDEEPTHGYVDAPYLNLKHLVLDDIIISPLKIVRDKSLDKKIARFRFGNYFLYFIREKYKKVISRF